MAQHRQALDEEQTNGAETIELAKVSLRSKRRWCNCVSEKQGSSSKQRPRRAFDRQILSAEKRLSLRRGRGCKSRFVTAEPLKQAIVDISDP